MLKRTYFLSATVNGGSSWRIFDVKSWLTKPASQLIRESIAEIAETHGVHVDKVNVAAFNRI